MSNTIRWYKSVEMDAPELNSPQPCPRGVHCDYRVEKDGELVPACCRFVHPGEEGNGRRIFPARITEDGREQPACVRLTGGAGFYERRRLRLSWGEWCEKQGFPYTPVKKGEKWEPVTLGPIGGGGKKPDATIKAAMDLCQPYMREQHPMQQHASVGGSTAFGLNPRAFDVMAQQHAAAQQRRGGAEPSKNALKNARKRANKKARAAAAPAAAPPAAEYESDEYIRHCDEQRYADDGPDCNYCHPQSGCDGDHGDEMRGGFIVRKGAVIWNPAVADLPPGRRWLAAQALGGGHYSGSSIVHDTSVPAGSSCAGCSTPARPPPLNLGGGGGPNYGFSSTDGAHSPRLPLLATAGEDDEEEAGCATPRLDAPISCSDLEMQLLSEEGAMEAVD
jgi:hypothetical protein